MTPAPHKILAAISRRPGITIPELAAELECPHNRFYMVLPGMLGGGQVYKRGRGWFLPGS